MKILNQSPCFTETCIEMKYTPYLLPVAAGAALTAAFFSGRHYPTSQAVFKAEEERRATGYAHIEKDLADMTFFGVDRLDQSRDNIASTIRELRGQMTSQEIARYNPYLSSLEQRLLSLQDTSEIFRHAGQCLDYRQERGGIGGGTVTDRPPAPLREVQKTYYLDPEGKKLLQKEKHIPYLMEQLWNAAQRGDQGAASALRAQLHDDLGDAK